MSSDINFGAISEDLNNKADIDLANLPDNYDFVIESQMPTSTNNYTWYRKYKSGWVEQGGNYNWGASTSNSVSITYPIAMALEVNALFVTRPKGNGDSAAYNNDAVASQTSTGFKSAGFASANASTNSFVWQVSGMAA